LTASEKSRKNNFLLLCLRTNDFSFLKSSFSLGGAKDDNRPFRLLVPAMLLNIAIAILTSTTPCSAWMSSRTRTTTTRPFLLLPFAPALSDDYLEGDLVAIQSPHNINHSDDDQHQRPRLCVVRDGGSVVPLCTRQDDVGSLGRSAPVRRPLLETQSYGRGRCCHQPYGEGFYGQRPVPSLGGGPGYGANADEVWSVSEETLQQVRDDQVELPVLDIGIEDPFEQQIV